MNLNLIKRGFMESCEEEHQGLMYFSSEEKGTREWGRDGR